MWRDAVEPRTLGNVRRDRKPRWREGQDRGVRWGAWGAQREGTVTTQRVGGLAWQNLTAKC